MEHDSLQQRLPSLLENISNPLQETRLRALRNVLFKTNHGLVPTECLVHERAFLVALLEWFNFPDVSHEAQVLGLLGRLAKHDAAAQTLVCIGAVEFLCQLRLHSDVALHPLIDQVVDDLLKLQDSGAAVVVSAPCSSGVGEGEGGHPAAQDVGLTPSTFTSEDTSDIGPATHIHTSAQQQLSVATPTSPWLQPTEPLPAERVPPRSESWVLPSGGWRYEGMESASGFALSDSRPVEVLERGGEREEGEGPREMCGGTVLPWLVITKSDQHVLAVTHRRLLSEDPGVVAKSLSFVKDVLLQDFPPELLLQRPAIVKALLELGVRGGAAGRDALECCVRLVYSVQERLALLANPAVPPLVAGAGDQEQWTGQPSEDQEEGQFEYLTVEVVQLLQRDQLSVEGFCLALLSHGAQAVKDVVTEGLDRGAGTLLGTVSRLVCAGVELLKVCSAGEGGLDATHGTARSAVQSVFDLLAQCLCKWRRWLAAAGLPGVEVPHQLIHCLLLGGCILAGLWECTETHEELAAAVPSEGAALLRDLLFQPHIVLAVPQLVESLSPLLSAVDPRGAELLGQYLQMKRCVQSVREFCHSCPAATEGVVEAGVAGLYFVCCSDFIDKCLDLCVEGLCEGVRPLPPELEGCVLRLLAHGSQRVREEAYSSLESLAGQDCKRSGVVRLLLSPSVLTEVVIHGLSSPMDRVWAAARVLVSLVMRYQMQDKGGDVGVFTSLWPYLEVGGYEDELEQQVREVMSKGAGLTRVEKTKGVARTMFCKDSQSRVWALGELLQLLEGEGPAQGGIPGSSLEVPLHDLLVSAAIVKRPSTEHTLGATSGIQKETVTKLLEVVRATSLEQSLQNSALEQLALIIQDYSLHKFALAEGLLGDVLAVVEDVAQHRKDSKKFVQLAPALAILCYMVHGQEKLRADLSTTPTVLPRLFLAALLVQQNPKALYHASLLICYLAFSDVGYFTAPALGRGFALPVQLLDRLSFPFTVAPQQLVSDHTHAPPLEPSVYFTEPTQSMLSLAWHLSGTMGRDGPSVGEGGGGVADGPLRSVSAAEVACVRAFDIDLQLSGLLGGLLTCKHHQEVLSGVEDVVCALCLEGRLSLKGEEEEGEQWRKGVGKFLLHPLSCPEDSAVLGSIMCLLNLLMLPPSVSGSGCGRQGVVKWVTMTVLEDHSPVLQQLVVGGADTADDKGSSVLQSLLSLCSSVVSHSATAAVEPRLLQNLVGTLAEVIERAGSAHYYSLPVLEGSLRCLWAATRDGRWGRGRDLPTTHHLCLRIVATLKQILKSFTASHGEGTPSFMGKGVTRCALAALLSIVYTLMDLCQVELGDMVAMVTQEEGRPDVAWLSSCVQDRDVAISSCGFSLLACLCRSASGAAIILGSLPREPLGLWSQCTEAAVAANSSHLVRQQAACVLLNLSTLCTRESKWDQLLAVQSQEGDVLRGAAVLELMLAQYQVVASMVSSSTVPNELWARLRVVVREGRPLDSPCKASSSRFCLFLRRDSSTEGNARRGAEKDESVALQESRAVLMAEFSAAVCPCVVGTSCHLLRVWLGVCPGTLVPQLLSDAVLEHLAALLQEELMELVLTTEHVLCEDWLQMWAAVAQLLACPALLRQSEVLDRLLRDEVLHRLWAFLAPTIAEVAAGSVAVVSTAETTLDLMCSLYESSSTDMQRKEVFAAALQDNWSTFYALLRQCLTHTKEPLLAKLLPMLCSLLRHRLSSPSPCSTVLEGVYSQQLGGVVDGREGKELCSCLLPLYDKRASLAEARQPTVDAFSLLLASSRTAKRTALDSGLVESCVVELEGLHHQLCADSTAAPGQGHRNEDPACLPEVVLTLTLLRNLLYSSEEAKEWAVQGGLLPRLHLLWAWCLVSPSLQWALLSLLCTLTAQCSKACVAMATCSHGSVTLVHRVLQLCQSQVSSFNSATRRGGAKHVPALLAQGMTASFNLLSNLVMAAECRRIVRKVGFLSHFSSIHPKTDTNSTARCRLLRLWLQLLSHLTLFTDGQQMVARTPDAVDILLSLWQHGNDGIKQKVQTVLHHLCFHQPIKSLLVDKESFLRVFEAGIASDNDRSYKMAASSVLALVHNCSKTRAMLRKHQSLQHCLTLHDTKGWKAHKEASSPEEATTAALKSLPPNASNTLSSTSACTLTSGLADST